MKVLNFFSSYHYFFQFSLMRHHHSPEAATFPGFKLLCFVYIIYFSERINCNSFQPGCMCHLALCLHVMLLHLNSQALNRMYLHKLKAHTTENTQTVHWHGLPAVFWFCSYVTCHHLTVAHQSSTKDQFYCTVCYIILNQICVAQRLSKN